MMTDQHRKVKNNYVKALPTNLACWWIAELHAAAVASPSSVIDLQPACVRPAVATNKLQKCYSAILTQLKMQMEGDE